ncbi:MAG: hypothetical protein HYT46_00160 [Candidatus Vogelbacteria bacterium]|nr:hypothetical protein [Candidatus Vogelbacteria bacterium]
MSKYYRLNQRLPSGKDWSQEEVFGRARGHQQRDSLDSTFDQTVLFYLSEKVLNHLMDSMCIHKVLRDRGDLYFNDYSFATAPAYKALEGFLFQVAKDLALPSSGNNDTAGAYYFDEEKIDKHVDKLLKELEKKADATAKLTTYEKRDVKDRIKEMKSFLRNYRHTPAHFYGESIDTTAKADMNVKVIYSVIQNTTKILLKAGLIQISDDLH